MLRETTINAGKRNKLGLINRVARQPVKMDLAGYDWYFELSYAPYFGDIAIQWEWSNFDHS